MIGNAGLPSTLDDAERAWVEARLHEPEPDRLQAFSAHAFGACIGVRVNREALLSALMAGLPPELSAGPIQEADEYVTVLEAACPDGSPGFFLYRLGKLYGYAKDFDQILEAFDSQIRFAFAKHSRTLVFIHAGAVEWRGKAVLFPGTSHAGKTSLVAALLGKGAGYISDEHAVLDEAGWVQPWSRRLSIRGGEDDQQRDVAPEALGASRVLTPLPVGLIISTRYAPQAQWAPARLSNPDGALELIANAVAARREPARVLAAAAAASAQALTIKTERPDLSVCLDKIIDSMNSALEP